MEDRLRIENMIIFQNKFEVFFIECFEKYLNKQRIDCKHSII